VLRGNPSKRAINHAEPQLGPPSTLDCPKRLVSEARVEWERLAKSLVDAGVLTFADMGAFESFCFVHGLVRRYEAEVGKMAPAEAIASGIQNALVKLEGLRRQLASDLGLTPSSRSQVKRSAEVPKTQLEAFIGGKSGR
jgi:P27 family predicted phage terminase small subunit